MRKLAVVLLLLLPSSVFAQNIDRGRDENWRDRRFAYSTPSWNLFELTPFGGYRWGGTLYADSTDLFGFDTKVAGAGNVGLNFGIPIGGSPMKFELMVNQQQSHLTGRGGLFESEIPIADFDVTYYHGGLQIPIGDPEAGAVPFLVFSAGITNLRPDIAGVSAENRFSASAGLGVKIPFNRNVGLRIEGRGYFTSLDGDDECYRCDDSYGDTLTQGETNIGLVISF
ncbi:MAG: hypothetical protein ACXW2P_03960 [Thermoanaerobaculia bacterium]